jgi:hypothetical protein
MDIFGWLLFCLTHATTLCHKFQGLNNTG